MAGPIPGGLSSTARLALPYIRSGLAGGLSANALQSSLSAAGIGVRRTELLEAVRVVRGEVAAADRLKFIRKDRRPDPVRLPLARTKMLREYGYVVELRGLDPYSGGSVTQYVTVSSSSLQTVGDIEAAAIGFLEPPDQSGDLNDPVALVVAARRKGALGSFL